MWLDSCVGSSRSQKPFLLPLVMKGMHRLASALQAALKGRLVSAVTQMRWWCQDQGGSESGEQVRSRL